LRTICRAEFAVFEGSGKRFEFEAPSVVPRIFSGLAFEAVKRGLARFLALVEVLAPERHCASSIEQARWSFSPLGVIFQSFASEIVRPHAAQIVVFGRPRRSRFSMLAHLVTSVAKKAVAVCVARQIRASIAAKAVLEARVAVVVDVVDDQVRVAVRRGAGIGCVHIRQSFLRL
jgi:hypothetical protein